MSSGKASENVRYKFEPYDCIPGSGWDVFERNLFNVGSENVDDHGESAADNLRGIDQGAPGVGYGGLAGSSLQKAQRAYRKRCKVAYSLVTTHILDADHVDNCFNSHFQDGRAAYLPSARAKAS